MMWWNTVDAGKRTNRHPESHPKPTAVPYMEIVEWHSASQKGSQVCKTCVYPAQRCSACEPAQNLQPFFPLRSKLRPSTRTRLHLDKISIEVQSQTPHLLCFPRESLGEILQTISSRPQNFGNEQGHTHFPKTCNHRVHKEVCCRENFNQTLRKLVVHILGGKIKICNSTETPHKFHIDSIVEFVVSSVFLPGNEIPHLKFH